MARPARPRDAASRAGDDARDLHADADLLELAARVRTTVVPLSRSLRQQSSGRLTPTQVSVLGTVLRFEPIAMSAIAVREQLSLPMVSKVITALEDEGLVRRSPAAHDGRINLVEVTDEGRDWVQETRRRRDRWLADRLVRLNATDRRALERAAAAIERMLTDDR